MTNFNRPLAAPQYTKLRSGSYAGTLVVAMFSNRVVFAGRVNSDLTTPLTWASFLYTSVAVGAYSDVLDKQVLLIGTVNDITQATFRGYTRGLATNTTLNCNESSQDFTVGAYFWVIDTHDINYVQSRPSTSDPATAVELVNYNQTYAGLLPRIVGLQTGYFGYVNPATGKLRLAFDVSQSEAAQSGATISSYTFIFKAATYTVVAGGLNQSIVVVDLIAGEQWGQCTVIDSNGLALTRYFGIKIYDTGSNQPTGGFKSATITAQLEQGYSMTLGAVADVDSVLPNTFAGAFRVDELYGGADGSLYGDARSLNDISNKQLTAGLATLTTTAPHGLVAGQVPVVADVDSTFNGTHQIISTPTTTTFTFTVSHADVASTPCTGMAVVNPPAPDFVGWLNRESDPAAGDKTHSVISTADFTFTGIGPRLGRLEAQLLALVENASPTRWGDITNLTPWRAIWHFLSRYTTAATLCDVTFDSTADTFLFPDFSTQGNSALAAIAGIAKQINAVVEFAPWGALAVNRDINFTHSGSVTNAGLWTAADFREITRASDPNPSVGRSDANGAFANPTSGQVTDYTTRAPGHAQGEAQGTSNLPGQVLASTTLTSVALAELKQRVGDDFVLANTNEFLDALHRAGYVGIPIIPTRSAVYLPTLSDVGGPHGVNRTEYDGTVQFTVDSVSAEYDPAGRFTVRCRYRRVTEAGDPGDDITPQIPAQGQISFALPDLGLPAFNFDPPELTIPDSGLTPSQIAPSALLPPRGKIATFTGQELIVTSPAKCYWLRNVINLTKPNARDITPSDLGAFSLRQPLISPAFTATAIPGFVLGDDSANSHVWYAPNVAALGPAWTVGANASGVYTIVRATKTAGGILIYSPDDDSTTALTNFLTSDGGYSLINYADGYSPATGGTWLNGTGWQTTQRHSIISPTITSQEVNIQITFSPATVTSVTMRYSKANGTFNGGAVNDAVVVLSSSVVVGSTLIDSSTVDGNNLTVSWGGSQTVDEIHLHIRASYGTSVTQGTGEIISVAVTTSGGSGNAVVRYSTDNGATWGGVLTVGSPVPGAVGGFDVARASGVSYAAAAGLVAKATALGGAYSSHTTYGTSNPVAIITPYFRKGSTTTSQTAASDPDYIVALDVADIGTSTLYFVEGATAIKHDITPVSGITFSHPDCVTIRFGTEICAWGTVSGQQKVYTSQDSGATWTFRGNISNAGKLRCRRNDVRVPPAGQLFLAQGDVIDYSSKFFSNSLYPRTMPSSGIVSFDTVY